MYTSDINFSNLYFLVHTAHHNITMSFTKKKETATNKIYLFLYAIFILWWFSVEANLLGTTRCISIVFTLIIVFTFQVSPSWTKVNHTEFIRQFYLFALHKQISSCLYFRLGSNLNKGIYCGYASDCAEVTKTFFAVPSAHVLGIFFIYIIFEFFKLRNPNNNKRNAYKGYVAIMLCKSKGLREKIESFYAIVFMLFTFGCSTLFIIVVQVESNQIS